MGHVYYRGFKFYLGTSGYYSLRYSEGSIRVWGPERCLHRIVWVDTYGPIPEDHVVHHIDRCSTNNDISNLQCMSKAAHQEEHAQERAERMRITQKALRTFPEHPCAYHCCTNTTTREKYCSNSCCRKAYIRRRLDTDEAFREKIRNKKRNQYRQQDPARRKAYYQKVRTSPKPYKPHRKARV